MVSVRQDSLNCDEIEEVYQYLISAPEKYVVVNGKILKEEDLHDLMEECKRNEKLLLEGKEDDTI